MRPPIKEWDGSHRQYIHLKYDGHFAQVERHRVLTRRPTDISDKVPWLLGRVPDGHIVLGEIYKPGGVATQVKTAINDGTAQFVAFAIATAEETMSLKETEAYCLSWGLSFANWRHYRGETREELLEKCPQEGFVLKDGNMLNWAKIKPVLTEDFVVLGFNTGARAGGLIASIRGGRFVNGELREVVNVSGMDDGDRAWLTENQPVGEVFEAKYQQRGSAGGYFHPRFVRMRPDKRSEECCDV